jgi:hypothetical protein
MGAKKLMLIGIAKKYDGLPYIWAGLAGLTGRCPLVCVFRLWYPEYIENKSLPHSN